MKIDDIKVGEVYYTRISGEMVRVRVVRIVEKEVGRWGSGKYQRRAVVKRIDNGKELPKVRAASALHCNRIPGYVGSETILGNAAEATTDDE